MTNFRRLRPDTPGTGPTSLPALQRRPAHFSWLWAGLKTHAPCRTTRLRNCWS